MAVVIYSPCLLVSYLGKGVWYPIPTEQIRLILYVPCILSIRPKRMDKIGFGCSNILGARAHVNFRFFFDEKGAHILLMG